MATTATTDTLRRTIEVYFLAAPEDQTVCEDIIKHLKPIVRGSPIPIQVNSDFNIPGGADREQYKQRLFEADIVLALISADFIDNDDIYSRNQKVIERHNNRKTVMIPILVRNCMWKATPFVSLPVVPKNSQPLNNKQFWNSPDDAVMAVVSDISDSINELAQSQSAAMQALSAPKVESAPEIEAVPETSLRQTEPSKLAMESPQPQSETLQPLPVKKAEHVPDVVAAVEALAGQAEPEGSMKELSPIQSEAVQPVPVAEERPAPALKAATVAPKSQATSQSSAATPIVVDWREKYYRTVAMKRALAILIDYIFVFVVSVILLIPFSGADLDTFDAIYLGLSILLYYVVMPIMESSKWQSTIGKRILKLQITDREGERITFLRAVWRNIMRSLVLYSYIISFGVILIIQYFRFQKTRKLFHDELSGTVIGERLASAGAAQIAMTAA